MKTVLLLIAFTSLIGVRFISRSERSSRRIWNLVCIINLTAVAVLYIGSLIKDQKIEMLKSDIIAVREYSSIANRDALGNPIGYGIGSDHVYEDELTLLFKNMYTNNNGEISMKRGAEAEQQYREIIQKFPKFPFGHYFLAKCLREREKNEWREHAQRALDIFKTTTNIDGHHRHHDEFLEKVSAWLEE